MTSSRGISLWHGSFQEQRFRFMLAMETEQFRHVFPVPEQPASCHDFLSTVLALSFPNRIA